MPPLSDPTSRPALRPALRPGLRQMLENPDEAARRFPSLAGAMADPLERRRVLKLMAASMALGGLSGCDAAAPDGTWFPAVIAPPGILPGIPNLYASAHSVDGSATGIVVEHRMGRPVKVEGNPAHPSSLGATDVFAQAVLLDFYDPDRAIGLQHEGRPADTPGLLGALATRRAQVAQGAGLRILSGTVGSPTLRAALAAVLARFPEARWIQADPVSRHAVQAGARLAYGRALEVLPRLDQVDVLLGLDSDLISAAPGHLRWARDLVGRRNPTRAAMNRIYAAEPTPTLLGGLADHRMIAGPGELHAAIRALAAALLHGQTTDDAPAWVNPVLQDLRQAGPRAFIHAGPTLPPETLALVHAMNEALGGRGQAYTLIDAPLQPPEDAPGDMLALLDDMRAGRVETLLILDANPAFTVPGFAAAAATVPFILHAAPAPDETAKLAHWHVPLAHLFETWGDATGHDGTATIAQPQALPLHQGRNAAALVGLFLGPDAVPPAQAVRATWRDHLPGDEAWAAALAEGVVPGTARAPVDVRLRAESATAVPTPASAPLTVLFRPDPHLWDGRHANNPWLQELPRPFTKLVWDNPLLVAPAMAARMGLVNGDMVKLTADDRTMLAPVWIMPGQAADVVVAQLGGGRRNAGAVAEGAGYDAYPLRGPAPRHQAAVAIERIRGRQALAATEHHAYLAAPPPDIARHGTLAGFQANPAFLKKPVAENSLYRERWNGPAAWGMSIDLGACIGCNACVVACTAENNVPTVGKENVLRAREMHWLRIDRAWEGPAEAPDVTFQPMLCMHCEEAPCETVCPVEASVHDEEGLNVQVYNRCVGTRFCSNNCPYKVRRFNFGPYAAQEHRPEISRNPEVDVRPRGVMEKCTFCIQRIAAARIASDRDGTPEQAVTACQAACPTRAIAFGDLRDPEAEVTRRKASPLDYVLLPDQQTHPRVTYEARIANPNPDLVT